MDKKELLRSMLNNLINDRAEEASMDFHNYLTPKTREVSGIGGNAYANGADDIDTYDTTGESDTE